MRGAQHIKEIRLKIGLSQEKFAQKIGVSKSAIGLYEMGLRHPSVKTVKSIIKFAQKNGIKIDFDYVRPD